MAVIAFPDRAEPGTASLWWHGQGSFVWQGAQSGAIIIDPFLSMSCGPRQTPIPVPASELSVDIILLTHDHTDHTDPETLPELCAANPDAPIYAPTASVAHLEKLGVTGERVHLFNRGDSVEIPGAALHAVFAEHTDDSIGVVIQFQDGPTIYHTADTLYNDLLFDVSRFHPDFMDICINGRWGNMNSEEAVRVTAAIKPKIVMPMHWDMFAQNSADPQEFVRLVETAGLAVETVVLTPGTGRLTVPRHA